MRSHRRLVSAHEPRSGPLDRSRGRTPRSQSPRGSERPLRGSPPLSLSPRLPPRVAVFAVASRHVRQCDGWRFGAFARGTRSQDVDITRAPERTRRAREGERRPVQRGRSHHPPPGGRAAARGGRAPRAQRARWTSGPTTVSRPTGAAGRLEGKKAMITGGDSGIGRAVALAFAREGADVLISYLARRRRTRRRRSGSSRRPGARPSRCPATCARRQTAGRSSTRAVRGVRAASTCWSATPRTRCRRTAGSTTSPPSSSTG